MKDQITHLPDNADRSVAKQKFKITNWPTYNKALINRGSITFWLDDEAIQAWYESATPSSRGRPQRYSGGSLDIENYCTVSLFFEQTYL
ncbi:TPA: transposase [Klebsiella pneumoniae]